MKYQVVLALVVGIVVAADLVPHDGVLAAVTPARTEIDGRRHHVRARSRHWLDTRASVQCDGSDARCCPPGEAYMCDPGSLCSSASGKAYPDAQACSSSDNRGCEWVDSKWTGSSCCLVSHTSCGDLCMSVDGPKPLPNAVTEMQRSQVKESLFFGPSKCTENTPIDEALNKSSSWREFADFVGKFDQEWRCYIQDFDFFYISLNNQTLIRTDYGLGDNDFGTFHNVDEKRILCDVEDGDLYCDAKPAIQKCLEPCASGRGPDCPE